MTSASSKFSGVFLSLFTLLFALPRQLLCSIGRGWKNYRSVINFKADLASIFVREDNRHATLDGVRAITILLMVMFHVLFGIVVLLKKNGIEHLDAFIAHFPRYLGWLWQSQGSDPLFILCGLLVSTALFREYDKNHRLAIGEFYVRRLMRVLPLFLLALLLMLPSDSDNLGFLWSNLLFISNQVPHHRPIVPVGWSLEVQMQFYFLLPFFILLLYIIPWRIAFLVVVILASFAWRYWQVSHNPIIYETPFYQILYDKEFASLLATTLYYNIDVRIGSFLLGILVAYVYQYYATTIKDFLSKYLFINAVLLIVAITLIVFSLSLPIENRYSWYYENYNPEWEKFFLAFDRYLYSIGLSLLVFLALCPVGITKTVAWFLSLRIWYPVAQLIFSIYLFHFVFIIMGAAFTFKTLDRHSIVHVETYQVFAVFFWTVVFTLLFSVFVHIYVEKPFLTLCQQKR
jgi:peptidoglycan/LPS O-acetylase OafA/YrhL